MNPRPILLASRQHQTQEIREIINPWDGSVVSRICLAGATEAGMAAERAAQAAPLLAQSSTHQRRQLLSRVSTGLRARKEELAQSICSESGKPITLARAEVDRAAEVFHLMAGEAERLQGSLIPVDLSPATHGAQCLVRPVARGPALAIGPFNFPLNLLAHKVAPALAAGAPVVVKPPPQAPTAALLLGDLITESAPADWPPGYVSVLPCDNTVATQLSADQRFRVVSFTGSETVGWHVRQTAQRAHVVLELGGDAAVVVCADTDLDRAAQRIAWGMAAYAGQVCVSVQRIYIEGSVRKVFTQKLIEAIENLGVGHPGDPSVVVGPVIDDQAADRLERIMRGGDRMLTGGRRNGRLLTPTLLEDPDTKGPLGSDEVFGPLAGLWTFENFESVLAEVNRSRFGLQAGLFTHDLRRIMQASQTVQVGGLIINDVPTLRIDSYPYGGTKGSGMGREGGQHGLMEYMEPRVLLLAAP